MNRIQMYASSTHLKHGLHRALAVAHALTSPVEPGETVAWWSLLDADDQERGRLHTLPLDALARIYAADATRAVLDAGMEFGALGGIVSGSGPTVAFLTGSSEHAIDLCVALTASGVVEHVTRAKGPVHGAQVLSGPSRD